MKISKARIKQLISESFHKILNEQKTVQDYDKAAKSSLGLPDDFPIGTPAFKDAAKTDKKVLIRQESDGSESMARSEIEKKAKAIDGVKLTGRPYKAFDKEKNRKLVYLYMLYDVEN